MALMEDLICKYFKAGPLIMENFPGTLLAAKACLSLYKNRWFFGCNSDENFLEGAIPILLIVFKRQVVNYKAEIIFYYRNKESSNKYVKEVERLKSKV